MRYLAISLCLLLSSTLLALDVSLLKEGDIIFQETGSNQGKAIQLATKSRYTHVGILFRQNKKWKVFEAVQPVKATNLKNFISRGIDKHFVIRRLKKQELLTKSKLAKMKAIAKSFLGKKYDFGFNWSDRRIYCSELVYKIFKRGLQLEIGQLKPLKSFDLSHPLVQKILRKRYGKKIPYDEPMVSPASVFASSHLVEVYRQ